MVERTRTLVTLLVLTGIVLLSALWGWSQLTKPFPGKVDQPACVYRTLTKGEKVFPQDVTVSVYNAGTRDGLAGRVMQSFTGAGFAEGQSGNATGVKVPVVQIWTTEPKNPAVLLVASKLGKGVAVESRDGLGAGVTVVVGDGFTKLVKGLRSVTAKSRSLSSTRPSPVASKAGKSCTSSTRPCWKTPSRNSPSTRWNSPPARRLCDPRTNVALSAICSRVCSVSCGMRNEAPSTRLGKVSCGAVAIG